MRTTRALAVAAVAGTFLGLAAPAASAWDASAVSVSPHAVPRGGEVTIKVKEHACSGGRVFSDAFPTARLRHHQGDVFKARATVNSNASIGAKDVTVHCGSSSVTKNAAFTVIHGGVRGGVGGSTSTGATATDMAIGGGLVAAAAIGGGVFWMRRRGESRA
ncbi:hypothetical protein [Streptomyces apocyni]|uniref:hypothetical protein n=1 Tax=Streptomyces apocyni TaxID=2654677 RepID=UPI0012E9CACE|nr:hypothetical protein [Streptomyces apocyni]